MKPSGMASLSTLSQQFRLELGGPPSPYGFSACEPASTLMTVVHVMLLPAKTWAGAPDLVMLMLVGRMMVSSQPRLSAGNGPGPQSGSLSGMVSVVGVG